MLLNHRLQDEQLVRLAIVLCHQVQTRREEGIHVHDSLKKITVQLVLKQVTSLQDTLILHLDLLVNLHGQLLDVVLQAPNAPVKAHEASLMLILIERAR